MGKINIDYCTIDIVSKENFTFSITETFSKSYWTLIAKDEETQSKWINGLRSSKKAKNLDIAIEEVNLYFYFYFIFLFLFKY